MRFLIPMLFLCSLAGFSQAQISQLPSGTSEVQVQGQTYYQHGTTFYRFNAQDGKYYRMEAPPGLLSAEQYGRQYQYRGTPQVSGDRAEGCRNLAADQANRHPQTGGRIYIQAYNRCMSQ